MAAWCDSLRETHWSANTPDTENETLVDNDNSNSDYGSGGEPRVQDAVIVLNRLLRSRRASDIRLRDRIFRAARIAQVASNSETALISGRSGRVNQISCGA